MSAVFPCRKHLAISYEGAGGGRGWQGRERFWATDILWLKGEAGKVPQCPVGEGKERETFRKEFGSARADSIPRSQSALHLTWGNRGKGGGRDLYSKSEAEQDSNQESFPAAPALSSQATFTASVAFLSQEGPVKEGCERRPTLRLVQCPASVIRAQISDLSTPASCLLGYRHRPMVHLHCSPLSSFTGTHSQLAHAGAGASPSFLPAPYSPESKAFI